MTKLLVCGSRNKNYGFMVRQVLSKIEFTELVSGACKDSADEYAEEYCRTKNIPIKSFPGEKGTFLKRNIEMVQYCDEILAFWDGFSYGTAHTIATAGVYNKSIRIIKI